MHFYLYMASLNSLSQYEFNFQLFLTMPSYCNFVCLN